MRNAKGWIWCCMKSGVTTSTDPVVVLTKTPSPVTAFLLRGSSHRQPSAQFGRQRRQCQRLAEVGIHACFQTTFSIAAHGVGGQRHNWQSLAVGGIFQSAPAAGGVKAIQHRHLTIHQHQIPITFPAQTGQSVLAVIRMLGMQPQLLQHGLDDLQVDRVVFHHQDAGIGAQGAGRGVGLGPGGRAAGLRQRELQVKPEVSPLAGFAVAMDFPAHQRNQVAADGESQPGAAIAAGGGAVRLGEGRKDARLLVQRQPDAGVDDMKAQAGPLVGRLADRNTKRDAARVGKFNGVADQVQQYLLDAIRIANDHRRQVGGQPGVQVDVFLRGQRLKQG